MESMVQMGSMEQMDSMAAQEAGRLVYRLHC